jgi:hypothetical protein
MLQRTINATVKEFELPTIIGSFKLTMNRERTVLGVVLVNGKNVLLAQENTSKYTKEFTFQVVETGATINLSGDNDSADQYIDSYQANGKLLHLFGEKTSRSMGGATSI